MPGGDKTGPSGLGPMTGRQAGYCIDSSTAGYANPRQGIGAGRGLRRGNRNRIAGSGRMRLHCEVSKASGHPNEVADKVDQDKTGALEQQLKSLMQQAEILLKKIESK